MNQHEYRMVQKVKAALTPDLLKPYYRHLVEAGADRMTGHCYVATEALFHLFGGYGQTKYKPMYIRHEGEPHWFLLSLADGRVIDATKEQFSTPVPYESGIGKGFLTRQPSARARAVIRRVRAFR
jgi:hypothetical protein